MTLDIKELREKITIKGLDVVADTDILELLDRLEAAESECLEEARLNGIGSEREAALMAKLEAAEKERDALRAKIKQMEEQEPVAEMVDDDFGKQIKGINYWWRLQNGAKLYALPGAQNVPEKLCYDSRWEISIDYVDGWNAAIDAVRGKSPSWYCPDCCIVFPFGEPKSCPHDDARCNRALATAPEVEGE